MACSDGLHTIGVFGNAEVEASGWEKCLTMSKISCLQVVILDGDFEPVN